jgi:PAS domain S-box-containing protein
MAEIYRASDKAVLETLSPYKEKEPYFVDGEELVTEIQKTPVRDEEGKVIGILGIFWDITEPVKAKQALERSEKQYRLLLENLTDGLYQMDAKGFITWASKNAADIFGRIPDDVIGSHILEFVHPDEQDEVAEVTKKAMMSGQTDPEGFEVKGIKPDGSVFYYQVNNKVLEEDGEVIGIQGLIRDVTDFRIAQNALEASEEKYRTFAENFQGIAHRGTLDWIPQFFHGSVEAITGYEETDFTNGNPRWDQIIHSNDKEYVFKIGEALQTIPNTAINRKYRIIKKNGEIRWVHEFTSNVCDETGVPKWVQGSIYDITDVVLAEKTLKRSLNDLEIYASLLQHDLRNDLQVLLNQSEISLLEEGMSDREMKYWKIVEGTTQSMIRLLDVFISPTKFYEREITNLIDTIVHDIEKIYPELQIAVISDMPSSEFTVIGSRLLPCVFDNLFRNVVEHAGLDSKVTIKISVHENHAIVEFSDDGPGIDKKILARLFQKGISTTGGGYGLYLSKKIIEAYEGTIDVFSNDKKGTIFRIVLPSI